MGNDTEDHIRALLEDENPQALTYIYDSYADGLYAYLLSFYGDPDTADEVLQRVFLKIAEHRHKLLTVLCLRDYLFIMTRNEAIGYRREIQRQSQRFERRDMAVIKMPEAEKFPSDECEEIATALAKLPDAQREVIHLKIYEDMTFEAIAVIFDISPNTAASRYRYGLDKLRKALSRSFSIER